MNQKQHVVKLVFTPEQIAEQKQFMTDLENNTADIAFEGSVLEAKAYLSGIDQLVDSNLH